MKSLIGIMALTMMTTTLGAAEKTHTHKSKYAGQDKRSIKSLSPDDVAELKKGGGWGLAKAAELNGIPGPAHLLEMKKKIALTHSQVAAITKLYNQMKLRAIQHGTQLIALERQLGRNFRNGSVTSSTLRISLQRIAQVRAELRYTHLSTHLKTPQILSKEQIAKYNKLRGYAHSDPCANPPRGHDPKMWRKHNGCK
jgi:hypothetical protein